MEKDKVYHLNDLIDTNEIEEEAKKPIATPKNTSLNTDSGEIKEAKISDLKPMVKKTTPSKRFEKEEMDLIDKGIERVKNEQMIPLLNDFKQKCAEKRLEKEMNGELIVDEEHKISAEDDTGSNETITEENDDLDLQVRDHTEFEVNDISNIEEDIKDAPNVELKEEDFSDDDIEDDGTENKLNGEEDPEKQKEERKRYNEASEKIAKILKPDFTADLSSFTVSSHPISINKAISFAEENGKSSVQSVPLYNTGRMISFTALSGSEIVAMSPDRYNSTLETLRRQFSIMYDHDASRNKPKFTQWLRSIDAGDMNQLYFGLYKATFNDANYVSYQCPKCKSFFMVPCSIDSMAVLNKDIDPKQKERLDQIINNGMVEDDLQKRTELYQVSSEYAIILKPKTLYNVLEPFYLSDKFRDSYSSIINLMAYIGNVYYIDQNKKELKPIDMKADAESIAKTFRNKCVVVHKMITSISADDYGRLDGKIINRTLKENEAGNIYTYQIPEQKCQGEFTEGEFEGQKCTNLIKAESVSPLNLLFTRHQLATRSTLRVD